MRSSSLALVWLYPFVFLFFWRTTAPFHLRWDSQDIFNAL
jgi:hypothetical protein